MEKEIKNKGGRKMKKQLNPSTGFAGIRVPRPKSVKSKSRELKPNTGFTGNNVVHIEKKNNKKSKELKPGLGFHGE